MNRHAVAFFSSDAEGAARQSIQVEFSPFKFMRKVLAKESLFEATGNAVVLPSPIPFNNFDVLRFLSARIILKYLGPIPSKVIPARLLWVSDSYFYPLRNYIGWEFLVFDYKNNPVLERRYYKKFMDRKLVYFFHIDDAKNIEDVFIFKKEAGYEGKISELILGRAK